MKRFFLSLTCALACWQASNAQIILSLSDGSVVNGTVDTSPLRTVKNVASGVQVTYEFDYVLVDSMQYEGRTVYKYSFPDFTDVEIPGKPVVPQRTDVISVVSLNYNLKVEVTEGLTLDGELYPSAEPLMADESPSNLTYLPVTAYSGFYPLDNAEEISTEAANVNKLCYVQVNPVRYDMSQQMAVIAKKITYTVAYDDARVAQMAARLPSKVSDIIHNIVLNETRTEELSSDYIPGLGSLSDEYLIITTEKFRQPAEELAEWKRMLGFYTHVSIKDQWESHLEVQDSIDSHVEQYPNIKYLLIIGNHSDVPGQVKLVLWKNEIFTTDYYYGCIDNNHEFSEYPNLYRGRILASSDNDAMVVIEKIKSYEMGRNLYSPEFFNRGLHIAHYQDKNEKIGEKEEPKTLTGKENTSFKFVRRSEDVLKAMQKAYNIDCPRLYWYKYVDRMYPLEHTDLKLQWNITKSDITTEWTTGAFYILFSGHGAVNELGGIEYRKNDVKSHNFGDSEIEYVLPIFFGMSCHLGNHLDYYTSLYGVECIVQDMLTQRHGGISGGFAATHVTWSSIMPQMQLRLFDAFSPVEIDTDFNGFSRNENDKRFIRMGPILDYALSKSGSLYDQEHIYMCEVAHCFGDPSMIIRTQKPQRIDYTVDYSTSTNECRVYTGLEPAIITFYDENNGVIQSTYGIYADFKFTNLGNFPGMGNRTKLQSVTISGVNKETVCITDWPYKLEVEKCGEIKFDEKNIVVNYNCNSGDNVSVMVTHVLTGTTVLDVKCDSALGTSSIDLSGLSSGTYVVNLIINGKIVEFKTIKI